MLFSIHMGIAAIAKTPELALTQPEAKNLATAAVEVAKHYPKLNFAPELVAWSNLIMAAAVVYVPRAIAVSDRLKKERMNDVTPKGGPGNYTPPAVAPDLGPLNSGPGPDAPPPGQAIGPDFFK